MNENIRLGISLLPDKLIFETHISPNWRLQDQLAIHVWSIKEQKLTYSEMSI